jgi:hypothetical protein
LIEAGNLAVNYACDVTTVAEKLRNFFARPNQRCPAVIRIRTLLNSAHIMSFEKEVHLPQTVRATAPNWESPVSKSDHIGTVVKQLPIHINEDLLE